METRELEMEAKSLKVVTTALYPDKVVIFISAGSDSCTIELPVRLVDPQISLHFAGAISSSPKLPRDADSENN